MTIIKAVKDYIYICILHKAWYEYGGILQMLWKQFIKKF